MNISVVRDAPIEPPVRSVVLVLSVPEALALHGCITSGLPTGIKDHIFDLLTQTFIAEKIGCI